MRRRSALAQPPRIIQLGRWTLWAEYWVNRFGAYVDRKLERFGGFAWVAVAVDVWLLFCLVVCLPWLTYWLVRFLYALA